MLWPALLLAASASARPPLTTIQDVIYKADGTRFNGMLNISWSGFEASDSSAIATPMITVKVVDGNLRVRLVPNTTAGSTVLYSVVYNSDGRVQFNESWAVPPSGQPLRLRDVRVATPSTTGDSGGSPVQESDVVGLIADLAARPLKGTAFASGRVTMVNAVGALDGVSGSAGDCVHVDGSSGPCGAAPSFVDSDAPAGVVDGANTSFVLTGTPNPSSSLTVYRNGLLQKVGVDYTVLGRAIQFNSSATPQPGDTLLASYRLGTTPAGSPLLYPGPQVLCSGTGATVASTSFGSLGSCPVPAGLLASGDRLEIRFDLEHQGVSGGFTFEVRWGGTTILHRDAAAADVLVTGSAEVGLFAGGARVGTQSWGTVLPFNASLASAADSYQGGLVVDFEGLLAQPGETLSLRNFTVVRLP
jgi:hypothetical protein